MSTLCQCISLGVQRVRDALYYLENIFLILPSFCLGQALVEVMHNQLTANVYTSFNIDRYEDPYDLVKWKLVAFAVQGAVFLIVNLVIESFPWFFCSR